MDRFWLEGELAVMFAAAGKGKSVLGVQLAEAIARGKDIEPFRMKLPAQKVLYLDLELSEKQFEMRFAADVGEPIRKGQKIHYEFSPDFLRAEAVSYDDYPKGRFKTYAEYFFDMLKAAVNVTGAKVVIVDDLAYLRRGRNRNLEAARLMRNLRELRDDKGLSILLIARTPSRATLRGTVTLADLEGSAEIAGFADNIFAIGGGCADPSLRYLKHKKLRSCEADFDETNVPMFRIEKQDGNFLSFRHTDFAHERDIVRGSRDTYDGELMSTIDKLDKEGLTQRGIAEQLGISKTTVNRYLMISGQIEEELQREEEKEQLRQQKRQKPLTPQQSRQQQIEEAIHRSNMQWLERRNAEAAARGVAPPPLDPHPEPLTPCSVFDRPDPEDDECDCTECTGGRPKRCLEKMALSSRSM
jgi:predicted transcriptional regulator